MPTQTPSTPSSGLDPTLVNLTKAIRQTESNNDFKAKGASGEYGAYQWVPATWAEKSKEAGVNVPLEQATPEQQNEVAYKTLETWKKQHPDWNVGNFASAWNAGEHAPDAYLGNSGTNAEGVKYDTKAYAERVATNYQILKSQLQGNGYVQPPPPIQPTPDTPPPDTTADTTQEPGFFSKVGGDISSAIGGAGDALSRTAQGTVDSNPLLNFGSGLLQGAGSLAGGVGSVTNDVLGLIPGVKQAEGLLGKGAQVAANTGPGKAVTGFLQSEAQAHPEIAANLGAIGNIATAIPIFKGLGLAKDAVSAGLANVLKESGEKAVGKELGEVASRTVGGRKALQQAAETGTDPVKILSQKEFQPAIEDGRYVTASSQENLDHAISHIDETELQPALEKANTSSIGDRFPLSKAIEEAKAAAIDAQEDTGAVEKYFGRIQAKFGDYPSLQQLNQAKRTVSHKITEAGYNSPDYSTYKIVRNTLQKAVEDGANTLGLGDVAAINQKMATLIKAQKLLKSINGKAAKSGLMGKVGKEVLTDAATAGGEIVGNATGIPFAGALAGRGVGGLVSKSIGRKSVGGLLGKFSRSGK